ncbi:MAG: hypothetical protein ACP5J1_02495 [Fervidicoccaceae archaeon]
MKMIRIVLFRDLGADAKIIESKVKSTITEISIKYGLRIEFLPVIIPDIIENFHPSIKVNEGKSLDISIYDENFLEDVLLAELAGGFSLIHNESSSAEYQTIQA